METNSTLVIFAIIAALGLVTAVEVNIMVTRISYMKLKLKNAIIETSN